MALRCHPTIPSSHHSGVEAAERVWLPIHALEILKTMERIMPAASACNDASRISITHFLMCRNSCGPGPAWLKAATAAAEHDQLANRFGLRAARQINHWRRHGESAFGEKTSARSKRSSNLGMGAIERNAGNVCRGSTRKLFAASARWPLARRRRSAAAWFNAGDERPANTSVAVRPCRSRTSTGR